ncbi:MAG: cell division protein FtsA [Candidatus Yonathbacteria bacterium]|nr:cell division protein FtsA [Candidatus Yonathbacteria bacterium]
MARRHISTGIDIGTSAVRVVIAEHDKNGGQPEIIGMGIAESRGLRHGYIISPSEAVASIRDAVDKAEKAANVEVKKAFVAVGGLSVESTSATGSVFVSRADNEVTESDIEKATDAAQEAAHLSPNDQIIQVLPIVVSLDGKEVFGRANGLKGSRLEVNTLFITCLSQHLHDFIAAVEEAGISVDDVMPSPIAASFVTLTKRQKTAGCMLANIGAETLSIAVFENNMPVSLKIYPIGGMEITNDIALGFKIPLEEAEKVKKGMNLNVYPKKKVNEIINARLSDIFDIIEAHLKRLGKNNLLPAGIVITGGSAALVGIEDFAKSTLKLPSKVAYMDSMKNTKYKTTDTSWSVAYGLCIMGIGHNEDSSGIRLISKSKGGAKNIGQWFKQFLP